MTLSAGPVLGRYGTGPSRGNVANYLIDFNGGMIKLVDEGRWNQDKFEAPASVPRKWVGGSRLWRFRDQFRRNALPSRCQ